jgi:Flp pilus assembly protein TadD
MSAEVERMSKSMDVVESQHGVDQASNVSPISTSERVAPGALFEQGKRSYEQGDYAGALTCFKRIHEAEPGDARSRSFLGLCIALAERRFDVGLEYCASAVKQEFFNPELYLNLARVHLAFGFKTEGRRYLLRGKMIDPGNAAIEEALTNLGARQDPVLRFLPRRHLLNRWLGSARYVLSRRVGVGAAA